jgi:multidrug efflux system membrane fusion protein
MRLSTSLKAALLIGALVLIYFGASAVFRGGSDVAEAADAGPARFTVIAEEFTAQEWQDIVSVRGATEAGRKVTLRAETAGLVNETPTPQGAAVKTGDVLCRLRVDAREAALAEARAARAKATLDFNAAKRLAEEGFRSETAVAAARAALDQARSAVEQAETLLQQTIIRAPFDGVFDKRMVEVGDFMRAGDACGIVVQTGPFLVVGAVSEKDIRKISEGDRGVATLVTGETVEGELSFVSRVADPQTRTFRVELQVPNENGALRDGVTASFRVAADRIQAIKTPRATLVLNDEGLIGVRTVDDAGHVAFNQVEIIGEADDGVFVSGLGETAFIITRGQQFVRAGQTVSVAAPSAIMEDGV